MNFEIYVIEVHGAESRVECRSKWRILNLFASDFFSFFVEHYLRFEQSKTHLAVNRYLEPLSHNTHITFDLFQIIIIISSFVITKYYYIANIRTQGSSIPECSQSAMIMLVLREQNSALRWSHRLSTFHLLYKK